MIRPTLLALGALAAALAGAAPLAAQDSTVVYLVRHAAKASAEDADPPLSASGEARARALLARLEGIAVDAVLVTQYQRTRQTAAPLLAARGLAAREIPTRGGSAPYAEAAAALIRGELAGRTVVAVGHTTTVPALLHALGGPALPTLCETEYANLFVIVLREGRPPRIERESYGEPDPPGADVCQP
jgi:broad specificity phosphatase PhoE